MPKIIDSSLSREKAIGDIGPESIRSAQEVIKVEYYGFDKLHHLGQIVIHQALVKDVSEWFELALQLKFPIEKVVPAVVCEGDDSQLMALNYSSGFNHRIIEGTKKLSMHAQGRAFDINPKQNPYIRHSLEGVLVPPNAHWDPNVPGTLYREHQLVQFMLERGWEWGGDWSLEESGRIDYQHFQKELD